MHQWYSNVFNNIMSQATVSWTMYMKDSDGSVVVVKSPKQFKIYDLTDDDGFLSDGEQLLFCLELLHVQEWPLFVAPTLCSLAPETQGSFGL